MTVDLEQFRRQEEAYYPAPEVMRKNFEHHYAKDGILDYLDAAGMGPEILFHWPEIRGGVLEDRRILSHMIAGNIDIWPFNPYQLDSVGYDVSLDNIHYMFNPLFTPDVQEDKAILLPMFGGSEEMQFSLHNPYDKQSIRMLFGEPLNCRTVGEARERLKSFIPEDLLIDIEEGGNDIKDRLRLLEGLEDDDRVMFLVPGSFWLGTTLEVIGGRNIITTSISGKSTGGRNMVVVCNDANKGDVGFINKWTLELSSRGALGAVALAVGTRVATIQFSEVGQPLFQYGGAYSDGEIIDPREIAKNWKPENMLPKQWKIEWEFEGRDMKVREY